MAFEVVTRCRELNSHALRVLRDLGPRAVGASTHRRSSQLPCPSASVPPRACARWRVEATGFRRAHPPDASAWWPSQKPLAVGLQFRIACILLAHGRLLAMPWRKPAHRAQSRARSRAWPKPPRVQAGGYTRHAPDADEIGSSPGWPHARRHQSRGRIPARLGRPRGAQPLDVQPAAQRRCMARRESSAAVFCSTWTLQAINDRSAIPWATRHAEVGSCIGTRFDRVRACGDSSPSQPPGPSR
jgi:hypothetical protein